MGSKPTLTQQGIGGTPIPIPAGRLSPFQPETSPSPAHPGTKHSNPHGGYPTTVEASSPSPPAVPTHTPPAAPPASRTGPGVVQPEFSGGFMPLLVTKKLLSPSTAGPRKPHGVQDLGVAKQRVQLAVTGHSPRSQSQPFP